MPTIIDSLFLELGIDTTKFSADQQRLIAKIQQFESAAKRSAGKAAGAVRTVGDAFRDLANESRIGSSASRLDNLASKFKGLGQSLQVSGGIGTPFGMMAEGLGALLSPAVLGAAAIGLVGKEVWDFNKKMTNTNATIYRNAQLSEMSAKSMWAWGEAAKTVGGTPEEMQAGIAGLQTAIAGQMIGVGNASSQLVGLARLSTYGARWNPATGVDIKSLFTSVYKMSQQQGWARTKALVAGYGLMNDTEFNLAMRGPAGLADYQKAQTQAPKSIESILEESVKAQAALGERQIAADAVAERAYGALQKPMEDVVNWLAKIYDILNSTLGLIGRLVDFIVPKVKKAADIAADAVTTNPLNAAADALGIGMAAKTLPSSTAAKMALGMATLLRLGVPGVTAAALLGNQVAESSMDPFASNKGHRGLMQWDKSRQAAFAKLFGYQMGSKNVSPGQQFLDQERFAQIELETSKRAVSQKLDKIPGLIGKTLGVMRLDEVVNDSSFNKRLFYAEQALSMAGPMGDMLNAALNAAIPAIATHSVTSHTQIGDVHVHTPSNDPNAHANAVRKNLSSQLLITPLAQGTVSLATRGMAG